MTPSDVDELRPRPEGVTFDALPPCLNLFVYAHCEPTISLIVKPINRNCT